MWAWLKRLFQKTVVVAKEPTMEVIGNDDVGWAAKYPNDKNYVVAFKRETAVFGCRQRYLDSENWPYKP